MKLTIQLFAAVRDAIGQSQIALEVETQITVKTLRVKLAEQYPLLCPYLPQSLIAVDAQYADENMMLHEGQEIACIPPVSGG